MVLHARERMQAPNGLWPRTETHPDTGEEVPVTVDGGRGGDLHGVHATLHTIHAVLEELRREEPREHAIVEMIVRDGLPLREIATRTGLSAATCSHMHHLGIRHLRVRLRAEGVVR